MRVLVIGSGGREHALVWKLSQSPKVSEIFCAPGNGGISSIAAVVDTSVTDAPGLLAFARKERIDLAVVGPEAALAAGVVDVFEAAGVPIFGPCQAASRIETSKVFSKRLMEKYGIPTAAFKVFTSYEAVHAHIKNLSPPYVIKADGICAGKGAYVIDSAEEAEKALKELFIDRIHGEAGDRVIVEGFLPGIEASYLALCDGTSVASLAALPGPQGAHGRRQGA